MTNRLLAVLGGIVLFGVILLGVWWNGRTAVDVTEQSDDLVTESVEKKRAKPPKRRPLDIALSTPKPPAAVKKEVASLDLDKEQGDEETPESTPKGKLGSLSQEAIDDSFREVLEDIRGCYQDALREVPDLGGRITVKFTIVDQGGIGRIKRLSVKEADFDDVPMEECLLDVVDSLEFEPPEGGMVIVQYPFMFSSG